MIGLAAIAVLAVAIIGLAVKYGLAALDQRNVFYESRQVTWFEYGVTMAILSIVVVPAVLIVGKGLSQDQILQYDEMYNGVEVEAAVRTTDCQAGSSGSSSTSGLSNCVHSYISGTYTYPEEYPASECSLNSKNEMSCTTVMKCCVYPSANIYTPFATREYGYSVTNSFGETYHYPDTYVARDATAYGSEPIPGSLPRGEPVDWLEAKQRLDASDPRPVTDVFPYPNYILASGDEMLAPYSQDVDKYREQHLLPEHTAGILGNPIYGESRKQAKKLSFVGTQVPDEQAWQESLMRFNAALGSKLQGDLHVVVIDSKLVDDPHGYVKALRAYWLGERFGKRALSKNGIILVIGTSGTKVDWAQMDTGMPFGNNMMIEVSQNLLQGKDLNPDVIFGKPRTIFTPADGERKKKVEVFLSSPQGVLEDAVLGPATGFKRPCMTCEDAEDAGQVGYKDLIAQIEPTFSHKVWMGVVVCLISLIFWGIVAGTSFLERDRVRKLYPHYRY